MRLGGPGAQHLKRHQPGLPPAGLEPANTTLGKWCLIHLATGASRTHLTGRFESCQAYHSGQLTNRLAAKNPNSGRPDEDDAAPMGPGKLRGRFQPRSACALPTWRCVTVSARWSQARTTAELANVRQLRIVGIGCAR
jgi:hypothetical protein